MLLDNTNIVLDKLQSLHSLHKVLLMQILLRVIGVRLTHIGLRHLGHELIQWVALVAIFAILMLGLIVAASQRLILVGVALLGVVSAVLSHVVAVLAVVRSLLAVVRITNEVEVTPLDRRVVAHGQRIPLRRLQPVNVRIAAALQATVVERCRTVRRIQGVLVLLQLILQKRVGTA